MDDNIVVHDCPVIPKKGETPIRDTDLTFSAEFNELATRLQLPEGIYSYKTGSFLVFPKTKADTSPPTPRQPTDDKK
jgi:hypothetical protein